MSVKIGRMAKNGMDAGVDNGFRGVVEPNHLSAPRSGQVYGQLPAVESIAELENGMFVVYDKAQGCVHFPAGDEPVMMVFNEEKLYDERKQSHRDYSMKANDFYDGRMYPRCLVLMKGDLYTTNTVADGEYEVGDYLEVGENGLLKKASGTTAFRVVKPVYGTDACLPDGATPAVQIQYIGA